MTCKKIGEYGYKRFLKEHCKLNQPKIELLNLTMYDVSSMPSTESMQRLVVRDLSNLVKSQDIIATEHLTTLLAIKSQSMWSPDHLRNCMRKMNVLDALTLFYRDANNFTIKACE